MDRALVFGTRFVGVRFPPGALHRINGKNCRNKNRIAEVIFALIYFFFRGQRIEVHNTNISSILWSNFIHQSIYTLQ